MKCVIWVAFLLTVFSATSLAAVASGQFKDPKHPGKCTIKENLILSPGEEIKNPDADCGRIICGGDGYAEFQTCGVVSIVGCKLGDYIDKSLPYPDCCKRKTIC
ncbi:uncharacterized protein LOC129908830 [Episyrphus balteatus]|uniref:uncharacterized protein LOC129908830 n=1 Tax=Episyrphus balteatus TaxID=286459 RepID=UPI0024857B08|nr:uncharacterized protein LOC129908830 [Episyrphus balteatus]